MHTGQRATLGENTERPVTVSEGTNRLLKPPVSMDLGLLYQDHAQPDDAIPDPNVGMNSAVSDSGELTAPKLAEQVAV